MKIHFRVNEENGLDDMLKAAESWWCDAKFYKETGIPFDPDLDTFDELRSSGALYVVTGRVEGTEEMVCGYASVITPYIFNRDMKCSQEVCWYVEQKYKGMGISGKLIEFVSKRLTELGVVIDTLAVVNSPEFKPIGGALERRGFIHMDNHYMRIRNG